MFARNIRLAWQFFQQEKHYPHQYFLRWTQAILMIFVISLSQISQNIQQHLTVNLANLLGADLVMSQQQPYTRSQQSELMNISNQIVLTQTLTTTLTNQDQWQQAKLKAVGKDYPLQGTLTIADALGGEDQPTQVGPALGEIWLDDRLMASLQMKVGDVLTLAEQRFTVAKVLRHEPDRLMENHNVEMRAMINLQDLDRLDFPLGIKEYRYLFTASSQQIQQILAWQKIHLPASQIHHKQGSHPLALFWKRTVNIIGLASIILFFMAAIAIEQLSHVYMRKEQHFAAVCISLGASKWVALQLSVCKWLLTLLWSLPVVLLISVACHWLIIDGLTNTFAGLTWQWHIGIALKSIMAIGSIFLIFQGPIWLGLTQASIRQLIHNTRQQLNHWITIGSALLVLTAVAVSYTDNGLLTLMVLVSMGISILLILTSSWAVLTLGEKVTQNVSGLIPFTLFMMKQRLVSKSTQILGIGLCAFLLLFCLMLLKDLSNTMATYSRQHDGDLLISQATQKQMQDIESWAEYHDINIRQRKPYLYAKLIKINDRFLAELSENPSESLTTLQRPIRLHWTDKVPANNQVIDGQWWSPNSHRWQQVSVEAEVMSDMGLTIGDRMTFFIDSQSVDFIITASHIYTPGAGSITYWVQMPPSALAHIEAPHFTMASVELTDHQFSLLGALWKQHPTLLMVPLKEITTRIDNILGMITKVISGFSFLIIILAIIVMLSSIQSLETKERQKNSIIMSFGLSRRTCLYLNLIEWIVTASIAAFGSIFGTFIAGFLIYQSQFSMTYQPDLLWLSGTLAIILFGVTSLGVYASKQSLTSSVRTLMSE